jgi:hypothetical protein
MSIPAVCPNGHRMSLPDYKAGSPYHCPICYTEFQVPLPNQPPQAPAGPANLMELRPPIRPDAGSTPAPPPARDEDSRTRAQKGRPTEGPVRLNRVGRGLGFHYARLVLFLLEILLFLVLGLLGVTPDSLPTRVLAMTLALVTFGIILLVPLLGLIGSILCLWVPPESAARRFIWTSLVIDLILLGLSVFGGIAEAAGIARLLWQGGSLVLAVLSWVFFMLFLIRLGWYFDEPVIAEDGRALLIKGIALAVLVPLGLVGILVMLYALPPVGCLLVLLTPVLLVVVLVVYIKFLFQQLALIGSLRQVIRSQE